MNRLRTPFLLLAIVLSFIVVLIETGTALPGVLRGSSVPLTAFQLPAQTNTTVDKLSSDQQQVLAQVNKQERPAGSGIPDLALLDCIMLFTVALMGVALILPERLHGRIQGIVTLIFSFLLILMAIRQIFLALASLFLMVALLLSIPFGTLIYLIIYGSFNRAGADAVLAILMLVKLGFSLSLVFAQQRFFESKGLVLLVLTSLLGNVIVSFLLGLVPGFLVSITDAIAAIVVGIIAVIWGIILLIGALVSIIKIIRLSRPAKAKGLAFLARER
ncbi:MAG TPA: hypothetical protein VFV38_35855 [Ktedonobacteraceae bacterium]|nr:hypothetical protein [Ktedonobacteraceae bacterium]